jgi:hypothetical protein
MHGGIRLGAAILLGGISLVAPGRAQTEIGVDLDLATSHVWRGVTMTNKPVAKPAVYAAIPVGNISLTVGGWANIDLGGYDDIAEDIAEGGGSPAFNLAEFDPYAEASFPLGKTTITGGVIGYLYPNDEDAPNSFGLFTSDANTVEIYGKVGLDGPLTPELSLYYDVDKVKGAYLEGSLGYSVAATETVALDFGAVAGFSAGQGISDDLDEASRFDDDGFTHLDVSAGVPFTAGAVSITPVVHFQINGDDRTKVTSPLDFDKDVKLWGGVSLSWSSAIGESEETEAQ